MKKAQIQLNFISDTITFLRETIPFSATINDLYYLPIIPLKPFITSVSRNFFHHNQVILKVSDSKSNEDIAINPHSSFGHPSADKLVKLVDYA